MYNDFEYKSQQFSISIRVSFFYECLMFYSVPNRLMIEWKEKYRIVSSPIFFTTPLESHFLDNSWFLWFCTVMYVFLLLKFVYFCYWNKLYNQQLFLTVENVECFCHLNKSLVMLSYQSSESYKKIELLHSITFRYSSKSHWMYKENGLHLMLWV